MLTLRSCSGIWRRPVQLRDLKAHDLRHAAATLRRDNGASIEDVTAFLGHRSIVTTTTYLARMEAEEDNGWQDVGCPVTAVAGSQRLYCPYVAPSPCT